MTLNFRFRGHLLVSFLPNSSISPRRSNPPRLQIPLFPFLLTTSFSPQHPAFLVSLSHTRPSPHPHTTGRLRSVAGLLCARGADRRSAAAARRRSHGGALQPAAQVKHAHAAAEKSAREKSWSWSGRRRKNLGSERSRRKKKKSATSLDEEISGTAFENCLSAIAFVFVFQMIFSVIS